MYPMKLIAPCKDYIWGGTRLREEYGKKSDKDKIAESWELSCHKDGKSIIGNGEFEGLTLDEYIEKEGKGVLGRNCERFEYFPILIKLIDAKDNLSVQVHPDNDYAMRVPCIGERIILSSYEHDHVNDKKAICCYRSW